MLNLVCVSFGINFHDFPYPVYLCNMWQMQFEAQWMKQGLCLYQLRF